MEQKEQFATQYTIDRLKIKPYATPSDIKDAFMAGWEACEAEMKNQKPETDATHVANCEPPALTYKEDK